MKNRFLISALVLLGALVFSACSRGITPYEAANGKAKCHRHVN